MIQACSDDVVKFFDWLMWTYDVRLPERDRVCEFYLYDFQERLVRAMIKMIDEGLGDLVVTKSRDVGATWLTLGVLVWYWLFRPNFNAHVGSRKAELVDRFGDKNTLFERMRMILDNIEKATPGVVPDGYKQVSGLNKLVNPTNGSVITGEATVKNFARQGRFNVIFCDEFSKVEPNLQDEIWIGTSDASPCRLFVSTSDIVDNRFGQTVYKLKDDIKANIDMITGEFDVDNPHRVWLAKVHWTLHPDKSKDAYYIDNKGVRHEIENPTVNAYRLFLSGERVRSSWYEQEVMRRTLDGSASSREVAQELDMEFTAAGNPVFSRDVIVRGKAGVVAPRDEVELLVDRYPALSFKHVKGGSIRIWERPNVRRPYGLFADCAQCLDTESDYDAFAVIDTIDNCVVCTGMGRWSVNDYAKILCLMGYYYNEALLAVEANDVGMAILTIITGRIGIASQEEFKRLQRSGGMMYNRLYVDWSRESETLKRQARLGWRTTRITKRAMISGLDRLMSEGWIKIPDERFWSQAGAFSNLPGGKVGAIAGNDDMVIAVAGAAAIAPEAKIYRPKPLNFKSSKMRFFEKFYQMVSTGNTDLWDKLHTGLQRVSVNGELTDGYEKRALR